MPIWDFKIRAVSLSRGMWRAGRDVTTVDGTKPVASSPRNVMLRSQAFCCGAGRFRNMYEVEAERAITNWLAKQTFLFVQENELGLGHRQVWFLVEFGFVYVGMM